VRSCSMFASCRGIFDGNAADGRNAA